MFKLQAQVWNYFWKEFNDQDQLKNQNSLQNPTDYLNNLGNLGH